MYRAGIQYLLGFLITLFVGASSAIAQNASATPIYLSLEQRTMLSYAILAQGEKAANRENITLRLADYIRRSAEAGQRTIKVKNFNEFLAAYRGQWPQTESLSLDISLLEKQEARGVVSFEAESPRVQKQIDDYIQKSTDYYIQMVKQNVEAAALKVTDKAIMDEQHIETLKKTLRILAKSHTITGVVLEQTKANSEVIARNFINILDISLQQEISKINKVGEKIAVMDIGAKNDPSLKILIQTFLGQYFAELSPAAKKQIVSAFLNENLNIDDFTKFEVMIQNSGPQMQKALQILARQGDLSPDLMDLFKKLESSVREVPWVQVKEILDKETANFKFTYFEQKPLGVGTMAQVHRAKILVDGERRDVVVRFIKPGMKEKIDEDKRILTKIALNLDKNADYLNAGGAKLTPLINDITNTVVAELDQPATIARQLKAADSYNQMIPLQTEGLKTYLKVHVPEIYPAATSKSQLMVQEMVLGRKLDKEVQGYSQIAPELKKSIVEAISKLWLKEVIFGNGFYHSDLHQGNFMVRVTDPYIQLNILDYGMGGVISPEVQKSIIGIGVGIKLLNEKMITNVLWDLSIKNENTLTKNEFKKLVAAKIKEVRTSGVNLELDKWIVWALNSGLKMPYDFVNMNRGLVIVSKLLEEAQSSKNIEVVAQELMAENPVRTYQIIKESLGLTTADLFKLGYDHVMNPVVVEKQSTQAVKFQPVRCEDVFL